MNEATPNENTPPIPPPPPTPLTPIPNNSPAPSADLSNEPPPNFDPAMFPARRRPFLQLLFDHNPCLLLSTVLMLLGCYLINSSINVRAPDPWDGHWKLLALIVVINLYEACIIPLGLILIRRSKGVARDGLWLLLFETLFIVNGTFLNVEPSPVWGWTFNIVLFILSCIKALIIFRGLNIPLSLRTCGFMVSLLAIIYGMPILFAVVSVDGVVAPKIMYCLYWLVGLLPLVYDFLARSDESPTTEDLAQKIIRRTYLIAPWLLLVAHLGFSHWAHELTFSLAEISPLLLGVTIAAARVRLPQEIDILSRLLPVAAFFLSFTAPYDLSSPLGNALPTLSPVLLTLSGMFLTYAYLNSLTAFLVTFSLLMLMTMLWTLQEWIIGGLRNLIRAFGYSWQFVMAHMPSNAASWGALAIACAFLLLAMGSYLGLRRTRPPA